VDGPAGDTYDDDVAMVLSLALGGDEAAVTGRLDEVVANRGVTAAYGVAWGLAARMVGDSRPRGPWQLDYPGLDEAEYDARWVAWFVSAYANEDHRTGTALFGAAVADGKLPECLCTLAGSTVATLRRRLNRD
jgi:hypothetical protein